MQVVVFEDFQCPFCRVFAESTIPGVVAKYPSQVAFSFRHYPLGYHPAAYSAAIGSECAAEQGRFLEFRQSMYRNQATLTEDRLVSLAAEFAQLDTAALANCMDNQEMEHLVERDRQLGQQIGVLGTPTFVINGLRYNTSPDSLLFLTLIDSLIEAP